VPSWHAGAASTGSRRMVLGKASVSGSVARASQAVRERDGGTAQSGVVEVAVGEWRMVVG